jgi:N-methylhydantoinase A
MNRTSSFGIGGGSLVGVAGGTLTVGPESAGAVPGPAAFGRGGRRATVTDVDLVAGLLADGAVLGGEVTLSGAAARAAVEDIARELGVSAETAAARVETAIDGQIGGAIREFLAERAVDPADVTLYGFGGAGPLHFARSGGLAGIRRMRTFPYGGVFSAFGCTAVDVRHRYEMLIPGDGLAREAACAAVEALLRRAGWDLSAEGFGGRPGTCRVVVEGADGRALASTAPLGFGAGVATELIDAAWPLAEGASTLAVVVDVPTGELRGAAGGAARATPTPEAAEAGRQAGAGGPFAQPLRTVWWSEPPVEARTVALRDVATATAREGPLLLVDGETVCAVPPDWTVRQEADGSVLWERR